MADTTNDSKIPPPDEKFLHLYAKTRNMKYNRLNEHLGLSDDDFATMEREVKKLTRSVAFSSNLPFDSQAPELITQFWDGISATWPEISKYADAWPVKALRRSEASSKKSSSIRPLSYIGKQPTRQVLTQLQPPQPINPSSAPPSTIVPKLGPPSTIRFIPYAKPTTVAATPRRKNNAQVFQTPSHPISRVMTPSSSRITQYSTYTRTLTQTLPSYLSRRKVGCFSCGYLADCSQQYLTKLSSTFTEPQLDIIIQAGLIDDYHFALFLRFSQDERREFFEDVALLHCSRLRAIQLQACCDELDDDIGQNPPFLSQYPSQIAVTVPRPPAVSSGAETGVGGTPCSCEYKPDPPKIGKLVASFLHSAGLSFLAPVFSTLQVTTDAEFRELSQLQEQYRSQFFECPDDVVLTTFQKFALKVAFRRHASAN